MKTSKADPRKKRIVSRLRREYGRKLAERRYWLERPQLLRIAVMMAATALVLAVTLMPVSFPDVRDDELLLLEIAFDEAQAAHAVAAEPGAGAAGVRQTAVPGGPWTGGKAKAP